jgi:hypothetical protein
VPGAGKHTFFAQAVSLALWHIAVRALRGAVRRLLWGAAPRRTDNRGEYQHRRDLRWQTSAAAGIKPDLNAAHAECDGR